MNKNQYTNLPNYDTPPTHTHAHRDQNYGVDFKMAANENALTQPKFELGITVVIQNVFQGD